MVSPIIASTTYDRPAVLHRYVSFDGTTVALQQDFSYSPTWAGDTWSTKTTTITTHDLIRGTVFQTVYSYTPILAPVVPNTQDPLNGTQDVSDRQLPVEQTVTHKDPNGTVLRTVNKTWQDQYELGSETDTLDNGATSKVAYSYGPGHTINDKKEYDYGAVNPTRETVTTYQPFAPTPIFSTAASIFDKPATVSTYDNGTLAAQTNYAYDQSPVTSVSNLPTGTHDETNYASTSTAPRGNLTTKTQKCFPLPPATQTCADAVSTYTFDETGQTLTMVDPNGNAAGGTPTQHTTTYSYADNFDSPPTSTTNTYLTQVTHPTTGTVSHIEKYKYAYADGLLLASTDQNGLVTQYFYNDSLRRLTETDDPDGGQTIVAHDDTLLAPKVTTSKKINALQTRISVVAMDGLGHAIQTQLTSDPQGSVLTDTVYDGLGRVSSESNPHRSGVDPTTSAGITTYTYDALSRKTLQTDPDGSVVTTAYCGSSTLATDPTGKWRRSRTDGLGRLVEVDEPNAVGATVAATGCPGSGEPIVVTSYSYDALNDLTQVVQNSSHQRTFTYNSLAQLLTSANPEVGTITYTYDTNGNVATKKDARNITTTYTYDALNRQTKRTYSNGDHAVTTTYDQTTCLGLSTCSNIGVRTTMVDAAGTDKWAYKIDPANLQTVHVERRITTSSPSNITETTTYNLDLAGDVAQIVYPTGRTVNYTYDNAGRPSSATDAVSGIKYAAAAQAPPTGCPITGVCYTPQGGMYNLSIGQSSSFTGFNVTETFNNRLQPSEIKALSAGGNAIDITYNFVDPVSLKNAGHVYSITNNLNSARSQSFGYDQVNRITSAGTTATTGQFCWGYKYTYDAWGNLLSQAGWSPNYNGCTETVMATITADGNNHISPFSYDLSGNALNDGTHSYTWDGESQLKSADAQSYLYDGDGRRVAKVGGKLYWYGSGGEILSETDAAGTTLNDYIFFGGRRVALVPNVGNPQYFAEDLLGSSRVVVNSTGGVCYDADFTPYGGERAYTNTCTQNSYKFEGKERDTETGNDDFGARYYSNRFGRWLSADWSTVPVAVPYANLANPQTLNLYAMVADDPESFADLDGHIQSFGINNTPAAFSDNCLATDAFCQMQRRADAGNSGSASAARAQSKKPGFWHRLGQHFSNLFHRHSWSYKMREVVTTIILPEEPRPAVTFGTDAAGLVGLIVGERAGKVFGPVGAAVSISNDRSPHNIGTSVLGVLPGLEAPMAITGAFNDFLDYGAHNNNPLAGKTWQNEDIFDSPGSSGVPSSEKNGEFPRDGGASMSLAECQMMGFC
jgi:RHS repeat-associated protein